MKCLVPTGSIFFEVCTVCYQSRHNQNTLRICTISFEKIRFHHHCQARVIHYSDKRHMPLSAHVIQCRIQIRAGYIK